MQINQKEDYGRGKQLCIHCAPVQRSFSCSRKLKTPARYSLQHVRDAETGKARGRTSGSFCCPHACHGKLEQMMQRTGEKNHIQKWQISPLHNTRTVLYSDNITGP